MEAGNPYPSDRSAIEAKRQQGIRPNRPAYHDTPLLSIGKLVRVQFSSTSSRRALIECLDDDDGTVDVVFVKTPAIVEEDELMQEEQQLDAEKGATGEKVEEEATVSSSQVRSLEPLELRSESEWRQAFQSNLHGAAQAAKECGNELFKLGDHEAASEMYGKAIQELQLLHPVKRDGSGANQDGIEDSSCSKWVLVNRSGALLSGYLISVDSQSKRADVRLCSSCHGTKEVIRAVPWRVLIAVHTQQLQFQGSLYLNRSRTAANSGRNQAAAQDLSMVIALWSAYDAHFASLGSTNDVGSVAPTQATERRDQLVKAYYLRAKTRLARLRIEPARADIKSAWELDPPEATAKLLRQMEREVEVTLKEKVRSNKKLAKEIAKLADQAFGSMSESQLAAMGTAAALSPS
eukprot:TRINITY_DN80420_c0_g1_i1.p1 TRINITY_DN80420_c0_g1~~TRINITY_DN80420_c0_g1_i1.p1  ORF type:complete len:406 (+),score=106.66 TRINITY_DN80420_c0_g1_i1:44-1261(+)